MKRILTLIPAIAIAFVVSGHANAAYDPNIDYAQEMVKAAAVGDYATGTAAEAARTAGGQRDRASEDSRCALSWTIPRMAMHMRRPAMSVR